ncbi:MAG: hypothetical protein R3F05_03945 [Planctomycetota bacterium]
MALKLVEELVGGRRDTSADHVLRWFRHPNWATVLDVGAWSDTGWFEVTRFVHGTSLADLEVRSPRSSSRRSWNRAPACSERCTAAA